MLQRLETPAHPAPSSADSRGAVNGLHQVCSWFLLASVLGEASGLAVVYSPLKRKLGRLRGVSDPRSQGQPSVTLGESGQTGQMEARQPALDNDCPACRGLPSLLGWHSWTGHLSASETQCALGLRRCQDSLFLES